MAKVLPMNSLIQSQSVEAMVRWEKTKNWRPYASIQETEQIEIVVDEIGKIMVQCEYIASDEIKKHILADQRELAEIRDAGLRRDSFRQAQRGSEAASLFKIPGLAALSGAFGGTSPPDKIPMSRPRVRSDHTPQLATFGQRLSTRLQNQLGTNNDGQDDQVVGRSRFDNTKLRQDIFAKLGPQAEADNT